jgi:hypothetical protein
LKTKSLHNFTLCLLALVMLALVGCIGAGTNGPQAPMTAKQKVTAAYSLYNSQYAMHMSVTGYMLNADGRWEKVRNPVLSEDQKNILRKKKKILTQMYPLLLAYDKMVTGEMSYSAKTEAELFALVDQLNDLITN